MSRPIKYGQEIAVYRATNWTIADQIRLKWLVLNGSPLDYPELWEARSAKRIRGQYELLRKLRRERIFKQLTLDNKSAIAQNDFGRYKNSHKIH